MAPPNFASTLSCFAQPDPPRLPATDLPYTLYLCSFIALGSQQGCQQPVGSSWQRKPSRYNASWEIAGSMMSGMRSPPGLSSRQGQAQISSTTKVACLCPMRCCIPRKRLLACAGHTAWPHFLQMAKECSFRCLKTAIASGEATVVITDSCG